MTDRARRRLGRARPLPADGVVVRSDARGRCGRRRARAARGDRSPAARPARRRPVPHARRHRRRGASALRRGDHAPGRPRRGAESTAGCTGSSPTSSPADRGGAGACAVAMNAQWLGGWDVAPARPSRRRAARHPRRRDVDFGDRLKARRPPAHRHARAAPATSRERRAAVGTRRRSTSLRRVGRRSRASVDATVDRGARHGRARRRRGLGSGAMYAWILDESPGPTAGARCDPPAPAPDEVARAASSPSALNHMDLWVTRGHAQAAAAARAWLRRAPGSCDAVGDAVTSVAVGDEVVVNPARVCAVDAIVAVGNDSPLGSGVRHLGRARRGRPRATSVVPAAQRREAPAEPTWEECAAYPLATLTAWRMLRRARLAAGETLLVVGVGGGVATRRPRARPAPCGADVSVDLAATRPSATERLELGRRRGVRLGRRRWPVAGRRRVESVGAGDVGPVASGR